MKTREELEKMFDEEIKSITMDYDDNWNPLLYNPNNTLKQFIFETIIPKILKSVIYKNERIPSNNMNYLEWYTNCQDEIKQKAKEFYNINL